MAMPNPTPPSSRPTPGTGGRVERPAPGRDAEGVIARIAEDNRVAQENLDAVTGLSFPFPLSMGGDRLDQPTDDDDNGPSLRLT